MPLFTFYKLQVWEFFPGDAQWKEKAEEAERNFGYFTELTALFMTCAFFKPAF